MTPVADLLALITISEAARLIASRKLSPVELTRAKFARINALEPQVHAFITPTAEVAPTPARPAESELAGGGHCSPLHGMPYGLKDLYKTAGIRTTGHSRVRADYGRAENAAVVDRLQNAGGVLMRQLATTEFAHGAPSFDPPWPPARTPWNPERFTGSSNSGSAAAVAASMTAAPFGKNNGPANRAARGIEAERCAIQAAMRARTLRVRHDGAYPARRRSLGRAGTFSASRWQHESNDFKRSK